MGFIDAAKKAAAKTKLQGELLLIDRELASTKQKHGVLIYDVLFTRHHAAEEGAKAPVPVEGLEAAFVAAMEDMQELLEKKKGKDEAFDALEEQSKTEAAAAAPATTAGDKAKVARKSLQAAGASTKLKAEMAYYNREMRVRKEIFGVQVFDDCHILEHEGNFEEGPDGVGAALNAAKEECAAVMQKKQEKEDDIKALN